MKVVIDFRMHQSSGIGTYIQQLVPFLVSEFEVSLLGNKQQIKRYSWADQVTVIEFNSAIYSIKEQFEFILKIPSCDVFWSPHFNVPIFPIRAKKKIVTIHDLFHLAFRQELSFIQSSYAYCLLFFATKTSCRILTISTFSKSEIIKFFKGASPKIELIYCAVDYSKFYLDMNKTLPPQVIKKYSLPIEFILYVGNVKPHKNVVNLLLAVKKLPNVNLVIVGKKEGFIINDNKVMQLIEQDEDLEKRVFFTGYIDNKEITSLYNLANVFVFPSLYEGFGLPPLEAQACGCPVISSNAASLSEVCGDSVLYCDPYDVDDIANKISTLLFDSDAQIKLRKKGFENIKRFSWQESAQKIIEVIQTV